MKLFTNLSIRAKLTAIISLLLWTISVFIFIYFPTQVKNEGLKDLDENARFIASSTAKWVAEASVPVDSSALRSALENALITNKLVYAVAETDEGETIVAYKPALAERANYRHSSSSQSLQILVYKASAPIVRDGKSLGRMSIGISMEEFNKRVMDNQTTTAWISLFIFLFGVVIVISASTIITNPLRNMVETVEQIAKGNFGTRARVSTQDEVGHLAFSFNKMVVNMISYYV